MPELPEVETVVRNLRPLLPGQTILEVRAGMQKFRRPWAPEREIQLHGNTVQNVERRGKWIVIGLERGWFLVVHLGMSGRLEVVPGDLTIPPHTHLVLQLAPSRHELRFRDPRRFGSISIWSQTEMNTALGTLGPEPFAMRMPGFHRRLGRSRRCLKAVLLDQTVVAGLGNIYADEALFEARLHPARRACQLSNDEAAGLRRAMVKVLQRAIDMKGSTISSFFYGDGQRGGYQNEFRVYQQTGQPCPRCKASIARIQLAGRSTHFCPRCQGQEPRTKKSAG